MKRIQALLFVVAAGLSSVALAGGATWPQAPAGVSPEQALRTAAEQLAFEWENAMVLSLADPCASYYIHRYRNEGNYGEGNTDYQQERGIF